MFLSFEGPEGSGKSTQASLLAAALRAEGRVVRVVREPGSTEVGEAIRAILHDPRQAQIRPETEFLLFSAARAQLVREVIRPALESGQTVICDRFYHSSLAYQGYGRGLALDELRRITALATGGLEPDLVVYLDLDVRVGLERRQAAHRRQAGEWSRLDAESLAFHQRVRQGYLKMAAEEGERFLVIPARGSEEEVFELIRQAVASRGLLGQPAGGRAR